MISFCRLRKYVRQLWERLGAKQLAFIYDEVACQLHLRLEKS